MKQVKHFLIGAVASLVPVVPAVLASPAVQHFIAAHPTYAVYWPVLSGVVVELLHRAFPTVKTITVPVAVVPAKPAPVVAPAAPAAPVVPPPPPSNGS